MKNFKLVYLFILFMLMSSCSDDEPVTTDPPGGDYENGYFVTNEGPFQNGSGTLTFIDADGSVSQNVYKAVNGEDLGNIVNSMYIEGDKAYIVVNNSHKIVVVNRFTMEKIGVIEGQGIDNPRYFVAKNGRGYVSNWGDPFNTSDDFIAVIDLNSDSVIDMVGVSEGPEKMIVDGSNLFVCLQGGYGINNQVFVMDINQNSIRDFIQVGNVPNSIVKDSNGKIWVLCGGSPSWTGSETQGSLYNIDPSTLQDAKFDFDLTAHPSLLNHDNGRIYFNLDGKVYQMGVEDSSLPTTAVNGLDGYYYGMMVHNGELYGTDAGDFASEGTLKVFNVSSGSLIETISAGIVPGNIVFP
jgi:hypothetical protein